jgi:hypothetical protein
MIVRKSRIQDRELYATSRQDWRTQGMIPWSWLFWKQETTTSNGARWVWRMENHTLILLYFRTLEYGCGFEVGPAGRHIHLQDLVFR